MTHKYSLISGLKQLKNIKPDSFWAKENKANLMAQYQQIFPSRVRGLDFYYFKLRPALVTVIVLGVILVGSWGTLSAAQNSLPGHPLYPVKRLAEKVRLNLVFDKTEKNVLRAEILNTRLKEAQVLARKIQTTSDIKAEKNLVSVAHDLKSEINILKKEIINQSTEAPIDVTFDEGSLPIQDGKKIAETVLSEDLKKSLEETKEFLAQKDLSTALTKTIELDKKLTTVEVTSTPENVGEENKEVEPVSPESTTSTTSTSSETIKPVLKKNPGSVNSITKQIKQSKDFEARIIFEGKVKTNLIREK